MTTNNQHVPTQNSTRAEELIRIIDNDWIEVTLGNEAYKLARWCPHEGIDLAMGHLENGKLYCSWHGLQIDVRTGVQPCKSLKNSVVMACRGQ